MNSVTRIIAAAITTAGLGTCLYAQDAAPAAEGWKSEINAGLSLTEGNSETLQANAGLATKKVAGDVEKSAGIQGNYGETGEETTAENAKAEAKLTKGLSESTFGYLSGDLLYDDVAQIDYRATVGPGLGKTLMKDDNAKLAAEVGVVYIFEEVAKVEDDKAALRVGETYERKLSETSKVWQKAEFLPAFEDFDDYLINAELGIEAAVAGDVSLRVLIQDRYDSTPAAGLDENDLAVIAGLSYKL